MGTPPIMSRPGGVPGQPMAGMPQGLDIWGILQRRKYLVALFCLAGAVLGYFYFTRAPEVYSSETRLMVTTQAPPVIVDGNLKVESQSMAKHASLISSEMVLAQAATNGNFSSMKTFQGVSYPADRLLEMLRVNTGEDETVTITCDGPEPEELPRILNQIVETYQSVIKEDSQSFGEKTMGLIEQLADQLSSEKDDAEIDRQELWVQLGIEETDGEGHAINPFARQLTQLQTQIDEAQLKLAELEERGELLKKNLAKDEEGNPDPARLKIAALEASEYLKLSRSKFDEAGPGGDFSQELEARSRVQKQIWDAENKVQQLGLERATMMRTLGSGNPKIATIDQQISFYNNQRSTLEAELEQINNELKQQMQGGEKPTENDAIASLSELRDQENREWIRLYQIKLEQEHETLLSSLEQLEKKQDEISRRAQGINTGIARLNQLDTEIREKREAVDTILGKLSEMNILNNNYTMTTVRKLDDPRMGAQIAPSLPKLVGMGVALGFLAGLGLSILIDQGELSFHSPNEIFEKLHLPVVGRIPRINVKAIEPEMGHASLVVAHKPAATASEAFRDIRTAMFFRSNLEDIKTILLTSPSPGDGKSTTIGNLAISIAQAGKKVVLVDADFRRPRVHRYFDQELEPGLLNVLSGEMKLKEAIQKAKLQKNLYLVPSGGRPGNPGELVTSEAFRNVIEALREKFEYVLIDSPPVLPVSDPATIASIVDGVYLVTRIRKGVKLTATKAKETLDRVGANWMGVIVNGLDENPHYSEYGYQYGGYSYYGGLYGRYYDSTHKVYRDNVTGDET